MASARDAREALDAIGTSRPDVAVVAGTLDGLSGRQLLTAVARDGLGTRVELCDAITAVARGQTVLSRELQGCVAEAMRRGLLE